jgi:hypothetical protein
MTLAEINVLCTERFEEYSDFTSEQRFGNLVWATFDPLDLNTLELKDKSEFESYFQKILDKVKQVDSIKEYQVNRMLLALKLKYLKYLQNSENKTN